MKSLHIIILLTFSSALILLSSLQGCKSETRAIKNDQFTDVPATERKGTADDLLVVDCLLPGRVRKLGKGMTYLSPRRPIKTTAQDCEIRGGEYTAYDRSSYATALKVWLPRAQEGDKVAQTYVGEIFEKGLGVPPDYALAARWYQKAAEQGYTRAQINLGYLYEQGLGVNKDPLAALDWYRSASGLKDAITLDPTGINVGERKELDELREEVERRKHEADSLRKQLAQTQRLLEMTRKELEEEKKNAETERLKLEKDRRDLEGRLHAAEVKRDDAGQQHLREQLRQRQAELESKDHDISRLQEELIRLENDAERYNVQLRELQKKRINLAGPVIDMINPSTATRGVTTVKTRRGINYTVLGAVTAPAGLNALIVNDQEEKADERGIFKVSIPVLSSTVPVKVVAVDMQGKRAAVEFLLREEEPAKPPPQTYGVQRELFGRYYALIIGNKKYNYWPELITPEHDAVEINELLRKKYGFHTRVLINATRADILRALNDFRKDLTDNDNLLVYYAGHGQLEEKIGRGYWIPIDGETDNNVEWISTVSITDIISIMSARHVLVVSDSCYSGAFTRSAMVRLEAGMTDKERDYLIKTMLNKRSRSAFTSGGLEPVLDIGGGGHSVFAKAFIDVLRNNDDILAGQRLHSRVSARVAYAASSVEMEQVPEYAPLKNSGHDFGEFFFIPAEKEP